MAELPNNSNRRDNASFAQTTIPHAPMTLEERKAFRREMLCQAIRQGLQSLEVISSMYRFKIINVDSRHHRFVSLVEVANSFKARIGSKPQTLPQVEDFLKKHAFEHFGLILEAVFWRVSGAEKNLARRVGDSGSSRHHKPSYAESKEERRARQEFTDASLADQQAYMKALRDGQPLPAVTVGNLKYESDLSPLEYKSNIDGPQFGLLE
jgi:hypothetical protein